MATRVSVDIDRLNIENIPVETFALEGIQYTKPVDINLPFRKYIQFRYMRKHGYPINVFLLRNNFR